MQSDRDVNDEAKEPWKGLRLEGHIDDDFLYATLLSKNLVPFGARKLHLVALPIRVGISKQVTALPGRVEEESFIPMSLDEMRDTITLARSADDWFERAEQLWKQNKKETVKEALAQWFNYQSKLTSQSASPGF